MALKVDEQWVRERVHLKHDNLGKVFEKKFENYRSILAAIGLLLRATVVLFILQYLH